MPRKLSLWGRDSEPDGGGSGSSGNNNNLSASSSGGGGAKRLSALFRRSEKGRESQTNLLSTGTAAAAGRSEGGGFAVDKNAGTQNHKRQGSINPLGESGGDVSTGRDHLHCTLPSNSARAQYATALLALVGFELREPENGATAVGRTSPHDHLHQQDHQHPHSPAASSDTRERHVGGVFSQTCFESLDKAIVLLTLASPESFSDKTGAAWLWVDLQPSSRSVPTGGAQPGAYTAAGVAPEAGANSQLAAALTGALSSVGVQDMMRESRERDTESQPQGAGVTALTPQLGHSRRVRARGNSAAPPPVLGVETGSAAMDNVRLVEAVETFIQQALMIQKVHQHQHEGTVLTDPKRLTVSNWAYVFHECLRVTKLLVPPARLFLYRRILIRYLFIKAQSGSHHSAANTPENRSPSRPGSSSVRNQGITSSLTALLADDDDDEETPGQTSTVPSITVSVDQQPSDVGGTPDSVKPKPALGQTDYAPLPDPDLVAAGFAAATAAHAASPQAGRTLAQGSFSATLSPAQMAKDSADGYGALPPLAESPQPIFSDKESDLRAFVMNCIKYVETRVVDPCGALIGLRPSMPCLASVLDRFPKDELRRDVTSSASLLDRISRWANSPLPPAEIVAAMRDFALVVEAGQHPKPGSIVVVTGYSAKSHASAVDQKVRAASSARGLSRMNHLPVNQKTPGRFERAVFARVAQTQRKENEGLLGVSFDPCEVEDVQFVRGTDVYLLPTVVQERMEANDSDFLESLADDDGTLLCMKLRLEVKACVDKFLAKEPSVMLPADDLTLDRWNKCADIGLADEPQLRRSAAGLAALVERAPELPDALQAQIDSMSYAEELSQLLDGGKAARPRFFIPSQEISVAQTQTMVKSRHQIAVQAIVKYDSICSTALREVSAVRESIVSGERKNELTDWWLNLVRTRVTDFLRASNYDFDAVPVSYIDEAPEDMPAVLRNLAILQLSTHAISESRKPPGSPVTPAPEIPDGAGAVEVDGAAAVHMVESLARTIYPRLDAFAAEAQVILDGISGVDDLPKDNPYKQLQLDVRYVRRMHELEDIRNKVDDLDVVPVTGLAIGRLFRMEKEVTTVVELHGDK